MAWKARGSSIVILTGIWVRSFPAGVLSSLTAMILTEAGLAAVFAEDPAGMITGIVRIIVLD